MQLELINVGRGQINKTVTIKNPSFTKVYKEVGKYLASKHFDIEETENEGEYNITVNVRCVGKIKVDKPQFMILL